MKKSILLVMTLSFASSSFAGKITCSSTGGQQNIAITINEDQETGSIEVDNRTLTLTCSGSVHFRLTCLGYLANSVYSASIARRSTRTNIEYFDGKVTRTIGGWAGNVDFDLGTVQCSELS